MSLQVWLPLNGNLNNQGLKDVIVNVSGTTTFSSEGKIGQCLSCNGSTFWTIPSFSIGAEVSICCWIKTSTNGKMPWVLESNANNKLNLYMSSIYTLNTGDGNNNPFQDDSNNSISVLTDGKWHHHVVTFGNSIAKLYIDGIYHGKAKTFRNPTTTNKNFRIAGGYNNGTHTYDFNGLINDVRIYDHALSAKEVEEVSKGLVLHYKLDQLANINNNLYTGSKNFSGTWVNGSAWSTSPETYNGFTVKQRSNTWGGLAQNIPATNGDIFTISFWAKVDSGGNILSIHRSNLGNVVTGLTILDGNFSSGNDWVVTTIDGTQWKRYWGTLRIDSTEITYLQWRIENSVANKNLYIAGLTLEKGYGTKVWSPSASENDSIGKIYDSSGYENHGTSISFPVLSNNTIRYKNSLLFDGIDDAIQFPYNQINPSGIFTVNLWFYKNELGSKNYETLFGGPSGFEMDTRSGSSTTLSLYMASVRGGNVFSPFTLNTWYMITMVRDGINELYYVNGNLVKTIEAKSMPTGTYYIGAWNVSTSQNYKGNISDFRLYATVLTEEQIKELYNTSATIDNNGNIYSRDFIENDNLNITKTGLFQTSMIEDNNNGQASIFKTKKILGTNLYEY